MANNDWVTHPAKFETPVQHRAFLLAYMTEPVEGAVDLFDPKDRRLAAVGRALFGEPRTSQLERWSTQFRWRERAAHQGLSVATVAHRAYVMRYAADHGVDDRLLLGALLLPAIIERWEEGNAGADVETARRLLERESVPAASTVDAAVSALAEAPLAAAAGVQALTRSVPAGDRAAVFAEQNRARLTRQATLVDKAFTQFEQALTAGKLQFRVKDLETLSKLADSTLRELFDAQSKDDLRNQGVIVDSVRVKLAKAAGQHWLPAVVEDLKELQVMAEALARAEGVDLYAGDIEDAIEVR